MLPGPFRFAVSLLLFTTAAFAQVRPKELREFLPPPYDAYFQARAAAIAAEDWQRDVTAQNWPALKTAMRAQLQRMLGLDPWPARGELHPVITGTVQGDGYRVEKLHFQSSPGLYVTGNLYLPADTSKPCPTILYVCGHAVVEENKVRMGNKTGYQHHGSWFARHGYVCLAIDTIQLGEIRGNHHGTYSMGRMWWPARGYTPAGVEAWNSMRALDYLETRPEVDRERFGITGRSGGGAYSWFTAAMDERIKVAVPTAGITTMKNHIVDGCIEGHCDCMYMVNSEGWDFDRLAALVAPRALLIANTDKDTIFPLDGVVEVYNRTRQLYRKLGQEKNIGLHIAEGPHNDTQPLNTGAFHWLNRFLKGADIMDLTDEPAKKVHKPSELKVFAEIPQDEKVTTADEWFVPAFQPKPAPAKAAEWTAQRDAWLKALRGDSFRHWPTGGAVPQPVKTTSQSSDGLNLTTYRIAEPNGFPLELTIIRRENLDPATADLVVLNVLDDQGYTEFRQMTGALFPAGAEAKVEPGSFAVEQKMFKERNWIMAYLSPRGVGAGSLAPLSEKKRTQMLRRFHLIGESLESGQVWDIIQGAGALREAPGFAKTPLWLQAEGPMAANAVYASLFIADVKRLDLHRLPTSHAQGPAYLNILRHLDLPQAVALAAERTSVALYTSKPEAWEYPKAVAAALGWDAKRLQLRPEESDVAAK